MRSPAPRCAASAWATSSWPPRSATSGTSRASPSRLGYLLDIPPKELEKVLYFASSIITSVDKEARDEDVEDLRDELAADLEELDVERDRLIEQTRKLSVDYVPEDDDFVDDIDEDERLTPEEVEEEIADIYEEFNERKALRQDAFDLFMNDSSRSSWFPTSPCTARWRADYRDYFTGGMGAESVRDAAGRHGPRGHGRGAARRHRQRQGPEARQAPSSA